LDNKVLYTCDTRYDPEMLTDFNKMFGLEAIFHDCQLFTGGVHASLDELKQLPAEIKKKLFLVHYGDNWNKFNPQEMGFQGFARDKTFYIF
ncbi:MAG: MBL fold metallo-hydrolase, partial [bacterium]|nr:MBL fold metallo-hydrolase [bacterium]